MIVELVVQFLVCVVDAKLLQTIFLEFLESINIQYTDEFRILMSGRISRVLSQVFVQFDDEIIEHGMVKCLRE